MIPLLQSTAVTVQLGPAVDKADGFTPKTGLTPTVYLSKSGAAFAVRSGATVAHDRDGWYRVALDATDTNTLGVLRAEFTDTSNHLPVWEVFEVMAPVAYFAAIYGPTVQAGIAQAGAASTITLASAASTTDSFYIGLTLYIQAGTGVGQSRRITNYVGSTRVATVSTAWVTNPDSSSDYLVLAG